MPKLTEEHFTARLSLVIQNIIHHLTCTTRDKYECIDAVLGSAGVGLYNRFEQHQHGFGEYDFLDELMNRVYQKYGSVFQGTGRMRIRHTGGRPTMVRESTLSWAEILLRVAPEHEAAQLREALRNCLHDATPVAS